MRRTLLLHFILGMFFFGHALAAAETIFPFSAPLQIPIYTCMPQFPLQDSMKDNPQHIQDLQLTIWEDQSKVVAGRPKVFVEGYFKDSDNNDHSFYMDLIGIPEFLGANMFHAFFMGSYTSTDKQKPSQFYLTSMFSMSGSQIALLQIDNTTHPIGDAIVLNTSLSCEVLADSIYIH